MRKRISVVKLKLRILLSKVARHLLEAGAKVDQHNAHKLTSLHLAAQNGHLALSELLLKAGADPNYPDLNGDN